MCNWTWRAPCLRRTWRLALLCLPVLAQAACRSGGHPATAPSGGESSPAGQAHLGSPAPQWTESDRPQQYVGQDLYNYIDGGAELFLELGFRKVTVRRYSNGPATLVHEVYEMADPTAARGVYLRFHGRGTPVSGVTGRNFGNRFQIAAQKDRCFVQVTSASGDEQFLPTMVKLVNQSLSAIPNDGDVPLLDLLPAQGLVPDSVVIIRGPYSLQSVFTLGDGDILELQGQRCGIAGDYVTEHDGGFTRLIVPYGRAELAHAAFQHLLRGLDPQLHVLRRNEHAAVFRETNGQFGSFAITDDKLDIRLHLARDPGVAGPPTVP